MQVTQNQDEILIVCNKEEAEGVLNALMYCFVNAENDGTPETLMSYIKEFMKTPQFEGILCD